MNTQKFMWIYDNIERYKFHGSEALAIKKEYCAQFPERKLPESEKALADVEKCYDKFVDAFFNDTVSYAGGFDDGVITSKYLDCYFIFAADECVPIGLYKQMRPVEAAVSVQNHLESSKCEFRKKLDNNINNWHKSATENFYNYEKIKNLYSPSLQRANVSMIVSVLMILTGFLGMGILRFPQIVFSVFSDNLIAEFENTPVYVLGGLGLWAILIFMCILLTAIYFIVVFRVFEEYRLCHHKKKTEMFFGGYNITENNIKKVCCEAADNEFEKCMTSARKGEDCIIENRSAVLHVNNMKSEMISAGDFSLKNEEELTVLSQELMTVICSLAILMITVFAVIVFCHLI